MRRITYIVVMLALVVGALASPLEAAGWLRIFLGVTPGPQPPAIAVVNPGSGTTGGGTSVVITGTSLSGATAVSFSACGAAASFVINGPSQITAVSPACAAQTVHIRVTTPVGISAAVTADQYQFNTPNVPSWVPFVGGQVASLYCDFTQGNYYYSGATQSSCPATVSRTGNETCTDASGNLSTVGSNVGCITTAGFGSTLQSFTNLALQSSNYQTPPWTYGAIGDTSFATTTTAPDGTNTARLVTEDNTFAYHYITQSITKAAVSNVYTVCAYYKDGPGSNSVVLSLQDGSGSGGLAVFSEGATGLGSTFGSGFTNINSSVSASVNGFWKISYTAQSNSATTINPLVILNDFEGTFLNGLQHMGTMGNGSYVWGLQVALGFACPPLIQTTTTQVTSNADVVTLGSPASTLLASTNAAIQVVTQGVPSGVASTIVDANGTVLLGENASAQCEGDVGATLASSNSTNWNAQTTCSLSWVSGTSGTINLDTFATSDSGVTRSPSSTFHLGSTSGTSAFLNGNVQTIAIYSPSVTFPIHVPVPYYFDSVAGLDTNNCQTTSTPCQTITKANSIAYNAGDSINLKKGSTFTDSPLVLANFSGTPTAIFTVTAYGSGANPIIDPATNPGNINNQNSIVNVFNVGYVTIENLTLVSNSTAFFSSGVTTTANVSGISNIIVQNNDISGTFNANAQFDGIYHQAPIYVNQYPSPITNYSALNNTVHDAYANIAQTKDIADGILCDGYNSYGVIGVIISGNKIYNTAGYPGGGVLAQGCQTGTVSDNLIYALGKNSHSCGNFIGIELYAGGGDPVDSFTANYNEIYNVQNQYQQVLDCDMGAYDFDVAVTNSLFEYTYAHDNAGYCVGTTQNGSGNTFRYNVCVNNNYPRPGSYIVTGGSGYPATSTVNLTTTSCGTTQAVFQASTNGAGVVTAITGQTVTGNGCSTNATESTTTGGSGSGAVLSTQAYTPGGGVSGDYWKISASSRNQGDVTQTQNGSSMNVYNNTMIGALDLSNTNFPDASVTMAFGTMGAGIFANNIFVQKCFQSSNTAQFWHVETANVPPPGLTDYNDYYTPCANSTWFYHPFGSATIYTSLAAWTAGQSVDSHSITTNPLLTSLTSSPTCNTTAVAPQPCPTWANITTGSPVEGVGIDLRNSPYSLNVGTQDYYGVAITYPHNLGADESHP